VLTGLLTDGALWHAGVLVGRLADVEEQLFTHATELARGREALVSGNLPAFAGLIDSISIERGLLERSGNIVVVPVECGWDDVGTWASVRRARDLDDDGNGALGDVAFVDSESNVVHSESGTVVLFGCERLLVVTLPGLTFVTTLDKAADLRPLLDHLPANLRFDPTRPPT
jgi:mannose-1-phosphate guanylyltransferase